MPARYRPMWRIARPAAKISKMTPHDQDHPREAGHVAETAAFRERLRRREVLVAVGAGVAGLCGLRVFAWPSGTADGACLLQRQSSEGPFYLDLDLVRRNIRRGRSGTPLTLRFKVVNAETCRAIRDASVEIWHCDARGVYSGVQGNRGNFLRGIQRTNSLGRVRFETIVPGWYPGRTPHIHIKVFVRGDEVHTGQVFFRPDVLRAVYRQGVYRSRGGPDTSNADDGIYRAAGARALLAMRRRGSDIRSGYTGSLVVGVKP
jgi:hypothetical protein